LNYLTEHPSDVFAHDVV